MASTVHLATNDWQAERSVFPSLFFALSCCCRATISLAESYSITISQYNNEAFPKRGPPCGRPLFSVSDCTGVLSQIGKIVRAKIAGNSNFTYLGGGNG